MTAALLFLLCASGEQPISAAVTREFVEFHAAERAALRDGKPVVVFVRRIPFAVPGAHVCRDDGYGIKVGLDEAKSFIAILEPRGKFCYEKGRLYGEQGVANIVFNLP